MSQVTGYLDAVTGRELTGWIANLDRPDCLEPVICRGENGCERSFMPFIPRHDVCDAYGLTGRFGFSIPLYLLRGLGGCVSLHDSGGAPLNNAGRVKLPPILPAAPGRCCVVLHIQKTAGTSLRNVLAAAVPPGEAVFVYPDGFIGLTPDELASLPPYQRAALRLVFGHAFFGIADELPGRPDYITFLREPAARLRSHYLHHLAQGSPGGDGVGADLPAIVSRGMADEFDNLMVRMVAGLPDDVVPIGGIEESHVLHALHNIRARFRFVGIVEHMRTHFAALCDILQLPRTAVPRDNLCRIDDAEREMRLVDWDAVMQRNRFDLMLYERVQAEGLAGRDLATPARGGESQMSYARAS